MSNQDRLHALDATRAFALLLGVVFHAGFSFIPGMIPGIWAIVDRSPSLTVSVLLFASHVFRMTLFFFIAGFFARMLFERRGARGFVVNRAKRILVPLVVGWIVVFPLLAGVWVWGLTKTFGGTIPAPPAGMPPAPPLAFPLTHLWFLYYLLVLYTIVVAARTGIAALDSSGRVRAAADGIVSALVRTRLAALLLGVPLTIALYFHANWIAWFGIPTPDRSLLPEIASLVGYGTAVSFGWLVHRQTDLLEAWSRQWRMHLAGALAATAVCLWVAGPVPSFTPAERGVTTLGLAFAYPVAIWCWTFGIIGVTSAFLSRPVPAVRYVSDASYWIYITHLPVVAAFQVLVGHLPLSWAIKFPLVVVASLAVLFVLYHLFVRSTFIGQMLNGRRYPRRAGSSDPANGSAGSKDPGPHEDPAPRAPLASLAAVEKRYGKVVALGGLDLDIRRGELLAVLGPNGAGKTTAISLWLGLFEPDAGTVWLCGGSPLEVENRRHVGVMMQDVALTPELRVRELIELTASYYPDPLPTDRTLALSGTTAIQDRLYAKLSGGQKRQVQFALAICGRPPLMFLDEPSVGLDVEARSTVWRTIRAMVAEGASVVLTTHYLEEAEALADRVAVLAGGRLIASGTVDSVRALVSRKQIVCSTVVSPDVVRSWPGVVSVAADAGRLHITAVEAEAVVRRLLVTDDGVGGLEVRQAGLAEAFIELTKEAA